MLLVKPPVVVQQCERCGSPHAVMSIRFSSLPFSVAPSNGHVELSLKGKDVGGPDPAPKPKHIEEKERKDKEKREKKRKRRDEKPASASDDDEDVKKRKIGKKLLNNVIEGSVSKNLKIAK